MHPIQGRVLLSGASAVCIPRVHHCLQGPLMYSDYCSGEQHATLEALVLDTASTVLGLPDLTKEQVPVYLCYTPWVHCRAFAAHGGLAGRERFLGCDALFPQRLKLSKGS